MTRGDSRRWRVTLFCFERLSQVDHLSPEFPHEIVPLLPAY